MNKFSTFKNFLFEIPAASRLYELFGLDFHLTLYVLFTPCPMLHALCHLVVDINLPVAYSMQQREGEENRSI
jgi:hypothetical protein